MTNDIPRWELRVRAELESAASALAVWPTDIAVAEDVRRGRRALSRRRRRWSAAALTIASAAMVTLSLLPGHAARPIAQPTSTAPDVQLAAYHGRQPRAFRVTAIPAGWHQHRVSASEIEFVPPTDGKPAKLLLAPSQPPGVTVSPDEVLALTVTLAPHGSAPAAPPAPTRLADSPVLTGPTTQTIDVGGRPGVIRQVPINSTPATHGWLLDVAEPNRMTLEVWVGPLLPWTPDEVAAFAAGV